MTKRQQARQIWQTTFQIVINQFPVQQAIEAANRAVEAFLTNKKL